MVMQSLRKWMKRVCSNAVLSEFTVHLAAEAFMTSQSFWLGISFLSLLFFFPFDFTLLDCRGSEWTEDMKCNIFSPSVLKFWSKEMLNAYYDFLVIDVNIICKDILLYIFVKCFLKANFNNKKDVHIWHIHVKHCHSYWIVSFRLQVIEISLVLKRRGLIVLGSIQICGILLIIRV